MHLYNKRADPNNLSTAAYEWIAMSQAKPNLIPDKMVDW